MNYLRANSQPRQAAQCARKIRAASIRMATVSEQPIATTFDSRFRRIGPIRYFRHHFAPLFSRLAANASSNRTPSGVISRTPRIFCDVPCGSKPYTAVGTDHFTMVVNGLRHLVLGVGGNSFDSKMNGARA